MVKDLIASKNQEKNFTKGFVHKPLPDLPVFCAPLTPLFFLCPPPKELNHVSIEFNSLIYF